VLATRAAEHNWADAVAGDMERHYSPGRTWEALARAALPMLSPGDVLDVAFRRRRAGRAACAALAPLRVHRQQQKVVLAAAERLRKLEQVEVREGDMQALPFDKPQFDLVLLMHALTYADKPALAVAEAARVLRKGGQLLLTCLAEA
jgi:ArsR family transcriptional regulator